LPDLLAKVSDRANTILRIAPESDQVTAARYRDAIHRAGSLVRQYGLRYLGDAGAPLPPPRGRVDADGTDHDEFVFVAGNVPRPGAYPFRVSGRTAAPRDLLLAAMGKDDASAYRRPVVRVVHDLKDGWPPADTEEISLTAVLQAKHAPGAL
jgi:hypothetical protein